MHSHSGRVICVMLAELAFGLIILAGFFIYYRIVETKRLSIHQKQWDVEKSKYDSFDEQFDAYQRFIKDIVPHPIVGKCFPRF